MLKRQDLVNSILDVFDYIDVLKAENENLKNNVPKVKSEDKNVTFIDVLMIDEGKKVVFENATYHWNKVDCSYDEQSDTYNFTSFSNWLKGKISINNIPSSMSYDDFITYFKNELLEMYKKEKEEALKQAKEERYD